MGIEKIYIQDKGNKYSSYPGYLIENDIGYIPITGYSDYFLINEKIYETEPSRTLDFTMPDINTISFKFIPHIYIKYNYMKIEEYLLFLDLVQYSEFSIKYFDIEKNEMATNNFYLKPRERANIYSKARDGITDPLGIVEFSVEFVCTMNVY